MDPFQKQVVSSQITGTWFGFYTKEEIVKLSVKQITNPISIDELGTYMKDGLYDPALGPQNPWDLCDSCGLVYDYCPGHPGHIELATPVYHPLLFNIFYKILRSVCFNCHHMRMDSDLLLSYTIRFRLLSMGKLKEASVYLNSGDVTRLVKLFGDLVEGLEDFTENIDTSRLLKEPKKRRRKGHADPSDAIRDLVNRASLVTNVVEERKNLVRDFLADSNKAKKCPHCNAYNPGLRKNKDSKIFQTSLPRKEEQHNTALGINISALDMNQNVSSVVVEGEGNGEDTRARGSAARYITTREARERTVRFFEKESALVHEMFKAVIPTMPGAVSRRVDPSMFFCEVLMVPPSRFRPAAKGAVGSMEHPQNVYYKRILNLNHQLYDIQSPPEGESINYQKMINTAIELQETVNHLMDNEFVQGSADPVGIKQLLEKKQGLFRKHMMGKRVNYAARSVISPDPYINTNTIGVPEVFAKKLTFPQPVTDWNYKELCERVINGPDVHPGANMIEDDRGFRIMLKGGAENLESRIAASKTLLTQKSSDTVHRKSTVVYRHLQDGDLIIMNRQPTLHKPSMMAHRALVQKSERVIRMHYANCKTFNADFDGDEMNMHFPQTQQARADAQELMFSDKQYIACTNGAPLRGLIQDHIVSGVLLTKKDTFFTRDEFQQLFYSTIVHADSPLVMPMPCIYKPTPLWSGKQLISAILKHLTRDYKEGLNLNSKSQVNKDMWGGHEYEQIVTFRNGELLTGVLDKAQFGAANYGLVHCCYELYGPTLAGLLLSTLGRLFTIFLQFHGFTCGMEDLIINREGNRARAAHLRKADIHGVAVATELTRYDPETHATLTDALRDTLTSDEHYAKLDTMVKTKVNQLTTEIISDIIPQNQMKRFPKNFMALMTLSGAKGSQVNVSQISCLLGQQELEGRRVPVMISGKTLPSFPPYDTRARAGGYVGDRFLTGIRPQEYYFHCMAGREGLVDTAVKTSNSGYLQRCLVKHLEDMIVAYDNTVRDADGSVIQFNFGEDCIDTSNTKFLDRFDFLASNLNTVSKKYQLDKALGQGAFQIQPVLNYETERQRRKKSNLPPMDPILSMLDPATHLGCVSENYEADLDKFMKNNPLDIFESPKMPQYNHDGLRRVSKDTFRALMLLKYRRSMAHPGEAVGVVAAQSVGEPSTQMTLNTFHLAGHGGANVTLGIPRLREVIMSATAEILTPMMTLPLRPGISEDDAYDLANRFYRLMLLELLREVTVTEGLHDTSSGMRVRSYSITLFLHDDEFMEREHSLRFKDFAHDLAISFIPALHAAVVKEIKTHLSGVSATEFHAMQKLPQDDEVGTEESATESLLRKKKKEHASYDDDEDDGDMMDSNQDEFAPAPRRKPAQESASGLLDNDEEDFEQDASAEHSAEDMLSEVESASVPTAKKTTTKKKEKKGASKTAKAARASKRKGLANLRYLNTYRCDVKENKITIELQIPAGDKKLLMVSLVERVANAYVVSCIPGIMKAFIEHKEGRYSIITNGVNIRAIWDFDDDISIDEIKCNHIHKIAEIYGIEAARGCLIGEIRNVFGAYGIKVDPRHLSLIADYMTFTGRYKACNRVHMDAKASPWLKMSFETTMKFLSETAIMGGFDPVRSPSASIVVGNPTNVGTGYMSVRQPLLDTVSA